MAAQKSKASKFVHSLFPVAHALVALLFAICGLALIAFAGVQLWDGIGPGELSFAKRLDTVLESLAVITVALAALEREGEADPAPVPEPATVSLLGIGLAAVAVRLRKR